MTANKDHKLTVLKSIFKEPCSYIPGQKRVNITLSLRDLTQAAKHKLANAFTQMGMYPIATGNLQSYGCTNCMACVPCRVNAQAYRPSRSVSRSIKTNKKVSVYITDQPDLDEHGALLGKYIRDRHPFKDGETIGDWAGYLNDALTNTPLTSSIVEFRDQAQLVGGMLFSVLDNGFYGNLFYYDPDLKKRGLGNFIQNRFIELTRECELSYTYFGPWTQADSKISYKSKFKPFEILTPDGTWQDISTIPPEQRKRTSGSTLPLKVMQVLSP